MFRVASECFNHFGDNSSDQIEEEDDFLMERDIDIEDHTSLQDHQRFEDAD